MLRHHAKRIGTEVYKWRGFKSTERETKIQKNLSVTVLGLNFQTYLFKY